MPGDAQLTAAQGSTGMHQLSVESRQAATTAIAWFGLVICLFAMAVFWVHRGAHSNSTTSISVDSPRPSRLEERRNCSCTDLVELLQQSRGSLGSAQSLYLPNAAYERKGGSTPPLSGGSITPPRTSPREAVCRSSSERSPSPCYQRPTSQGGGYIPASRQAELMRVCRTAPEREAWDTASLVLSAFGYNYSSLHDEEHRAAGR